MKYCTQCGSQLEDGSAFCTYCGAKVSDPNTEATKQTADPSQQNGATAAAPQKPREIWSSGLGTAIKVLMVLSCIAQGWMLIPLAWCIPLTVTAFRAINNQQPISVAVKVCTLLFVNTIAGIIMLTVSDN